MKGCLGRISGGALLIVVFVIAAVFWRQPTGSPEAPEPSEAGRQFAEAWQAGNLDSLDYDPSGADDLDRGDADQIADEAARMVARLSSQDEDHPVSVVAVGAARRVDQPEGDLRVGDHMQPLEVTWDLGHGRTWTYRTEVALRTEDSRQRVLWRPSAVHPALTRGLGLEARRLRPARAPVLDAQARPLPAGLATQLVGTTAPATRQLAAIAPDRVAVEDIVGTSGLQLLYDAQLAGAAGVEVVAVPLGDAAPVQPPVRQLFVVPPVPGKPLRLTLDPTWQARADAAARSAGGAVGVIALDGLTGQVLAVTSSGGDGRELALQGRYPAGAAFRTVTTLAVLRSGVLGEGPGAELVAGDRTALDRLALDCRPLDVEGQRFTNPSAAPQGSPTPMGAGLADGCLTGLGRLAGSLAADDLASAARTLGIGVPSATGVQAFDGLVPRPKGTLQSVQNSLGEGSVLVSPLALARAAAAVSTGTAPIPTLIGAPTTPTPDAVPLALGEQAVLDEVMRRSVRSDERLAALRSASAGAVAAITGSAGYGPSAQAPADAWCTGYQGSVAFAVLVADGATRSDDELTRRAAGVAAALLG